MSEFNPVISQEEFEGMGIFDEKPQIKPNTARVYLGTGEQCAVFYSSGNITRSELMAGKYSNVYVIDLREFQKTYDQPVGSMDDLAGFIATINLSVRVTRPDIFTKSMVKNVMKLVQQKLIPYLENISMGFPPDRSQDLQRDCLTQLSKTTFREDLERDYGISVRLESILTKPDANALELIQQSRKIQDEHEKAIIKLEEEFKLQMARQKKETEIQLAEMEQQIEIRNREAELKKQKQRTDLGDIPAQNNHEAAEKEDTTFIVKDEPINNQSYEGEEQE
jgi:hypothetical protein